MGCNPNASANVGYYGSVCGDNPKQYRIGSNAIGLKIAEGRAVDEYSCVWVIGRSFR